MGDATFGVEIEFCRFGPWCAEPGERIFDAVDRGKWMPWTLSGEAVEVGFGDEEDVRAADVEVVEDGVDVTDKFAEVVLVDVVSKNQRQTMDCVSVRIRGAGAHVDFSVNEFETNAPGVHSPSMRYWRAVSCVLRVMGNSKNSVRL